MTNPLNLNDEEKFPVLNGIFKYLDRFTPKKKLDIYSHKQYNLKKWNGEINASAETLEQTRMDINQSIAIVKGSIGRIMADYRTYIDKLYRERDYLFAINLADNQRDYCIKTYNKYVIQEVESYCNYIQDGLKTTFYPAFKIPEKENLNIKQCFSFWFEKFEVKGKTIEPLNLKNLEIEKEIDNGKKIMVNCTPAQFATIIEALMKKDYLAKRNNAEGTAKLLLKIFEFKEHNPSYESLGSNLFKEKVKINADDYEDLNKIIHRKYLKGNKD